MVIAAFVIKLSDKLVASYTITEPLLTQDQFSAMIRLVFVTTLMAPLSLKWTVKSACSIDENEQFRSLWDKAGRVEYLLHVSGCNLFIWGDFKIGKEIICSVFRRRLTCSRTGWETIRKRDSEKLT